MCSLPVLARIFDLFDADGDGMVSEADLMTFIGELIGNKGIHNQEETELHMLANGVPFDNTIEEQSSAVYKSFSNISDIQK